MPLPLFTGERSEIVGPKRRVTLTEAEEQSAGVQEAVSLGKLRRVGVAPEPDAEAEATSVDRAVLTPSPSEDFNG